MERQKLFVGNLNFETTEDEVKALFSKCGTVKAIRIRQKKGTAFVEMSTPEEAAAAIKQLDQHEFKDRPLRVNLEVSKKKAKAATRDRYKESAKKKKSKKKSD
ncbi:MAG: RNA-binding protein [Deltaproteobacteria bacterium]|jgi:RNA recognition motif-containing protein|nr:RNA-binding protein [Deltaproteobacteria bacterium]MBT4643125.1 RNA-binding protein [Deltaproteobacteria bacterium]MBT6613527.1 RNA-binding protein [Deltaproteobacteria bacterium]MBT7716056.1 RNA-binding protein [Deltaproteobacteria bacterium]